MSLPQLYLRCEWCMHFFEHNGGKRKRFCSDAHKQAAWRAQQAGAEVRAAGPDRNCKCVIVPPVK